MKRTLPRRLMTARSALYFCAMMAIATISRAQLINIKVDGFVHFSTSDTLPLGAGVHLSFTLPDPPIGRPNPVFPGRIFSYDSLASSVVVGATNFRWLPILRTSERATCRRVRTVLRQPGMPFFTTRLTAWRSTSPPGRMT